MRKLFLFILLLAGLAAGAVLAQEDLTQTYTSADGSFSFSYPQGWSVVDQGAGEIYLVSDSSIDPNPRTPVATGQVRVGFAPPEQLTMLGLATTVEPRVAIDTLAGLLDSNGVTPSAIEDLTVGDHRAAQIEFSDGTVDSMLIAVRLEGGTVTMLVDTAPGEIEAIRATVTAIAESIAYQPPSPASGGGQPAPASTQYRFVTGTTLSYPADWTLTKENDEWIELDAGGAARVTVYNPAPFGTDFLVQQFGLDQANILQSAMIRTAGSIFPLRTVDPTQIQYFDAGGKQAASYSDQTGPEIYYVIVILPGDRLAMVKAETNPDQGPALPDDLRKAVTAVAASMSRPS